MTGFGRNHGSATAQNMGTAWWDRGIYVRSLREYTSLELSVPVRMISNLRRAFGDNGLRFAHNPYGVTFIRPIENAVGRTIVIQRSNGEERLSPAPQIPTYSRESSIVEEYTWQVRDQACREPAIREKLLAP